MNGKETKTVYKMFIQVYITFAARRKNAFNFLVCMTRVNFSEGRFILILKFFQEKLCNIA